MPIENILPTPFSEATSPTVIMCRPSYALFAGALVLATLLNESVCFTLHRFDQINDDPRDVSVDAHHPATATGSDDEFSPASHDRLFKRSAVPPAQLTAAEWQLLFRQMIRQHDVDSSGERSRPAGVDRQRLDASDELDDDAWQSVELLKKLFGSSWESVKGMMFDHTSTEDLIEDWIRTLNQATR